MGLGQRWRPFDLANKTNSIMPGQCSGHALLSSRADNCSALVHVTMGQQPDIGTPESGTFSGSRPAHRFGQAQIQTIQNESEATFA